MSSDNNIRINVSSGGVKYRFNIENVTPNNSNVSYIHIRLPDAKDSANRNQTLTRQQVTSILGNETMNARRVNRQNRRSRNRLSEVQNVPHEQNTHIMQNTQNIPYVQQSSRTQNVSRTQPRRLHDICDDYLLSMVANNIRLPPNLRPLYVVLPSNTVDNNIPLGSSNLTNENPSVPRVLFQFNPERDQDENRYVLRRSTALRNLYDVSANNALADTVLNPETYYVDSDQESQNNTNTGTTSMTNSSTIRSDTQMSENTGNYTNTENVNRIYVTTGNIESSNIASTTNTSPATSTTNTSTAANTTEPNNIPIIEDADDSDSEENNNFKTIHQETTSNDTEQISESKEQNEKQIQESAANFINFANNVANMSSIISAQTMFREAGNKNRRPVSIENCIMKMPRYAEIANSKQVELEFYIETVKAVDELLRLAMNSTQIGIAQQGKLLDVEFGKNLLKMFTRMNNDNFISFINLTERIIDGEDARQTDNRCRLKSLANMFRDGKLNDVLYVLDNNNCYCRYCHND